MSLNGLQRAQDIAARVVMDAHRRTDAKPLLRQLHWLPVRQRILFEMAVLSGTHNQHTHIPQPAPSSTHRNLLHTFVITPTAQNGKQWE